MRAFGLCIRDSALVSWQGGGVSDSVMLAERLRHEVETGQLEGLGELCIEGNALVVRWRGGTVPPEMRRLIAESDTRVIVRSCRYTERELREAVQTLVGEWGRLPFTMVSVGPLAEAAGVEVGVAEPELQRAREHFTAHPLHLPNGSPIHIHLEPTGYLPLLTYPLRPRTAEELAGIDVERYIGLHVDEATLGALVDGWIVRSYADNAGGGLTLDLRGNRLNLCHDRHGTVISVDVG